MQKYTNMQKVYKHAEVHKYTESVQTPESTQIQEVHKYTESVQTQEVHKTTPLDKTTPTQNHPYTTSLLLFIYKNLFTKPKAQPYELYGTLFLLVIRIEISHH